jgi:hypothetical protein
MIDPPKGGATGAYIVAGTFTQRFLVYMAPTPPAPASSRGPEAMGPRLPPLSRPLVGAGMDMTERWTGHRPASSFYPQPAAPE